MPTRVGFQLGMKSISRMNTVSHLVRPDRSSFLGYHGWDCPQMPGLETVEIIVVEVDSEDRWIGRYIDRGKGTGMGRQKETESGLLGVF